MTERITTLYSRSADLWREWLTGESPHYVDTLYKLTDDLCDAMGGGNILTVDMGNEAWIVMPAPYSLYMQQRTLVIYVVQDRINLDFCWKVKTYGTIALTTDDAEDDARVLCAALAEFMGWEEEDAE